MEWLTGYSTVGETRVRSALPPFLLVMRAPLLIASAMTSRMYAGFSGSGSGVMATPSSHGMPSLSASTAALNFSMKRSAMLSGTQTILMAVQRWPL